MKDENFVYRVIMNNIDTLRKEGPKYVMFPEPSTSKTDILEFLDRIQYCFGTELFRKIDCQFSNFVVEEIDDGLNLVEFNVKFPHRQYDTQVILYQKEFREDCRIEFSTEEKEEVFIDKINLSSYHKDIDQAVLDQSIYTYYEKEIGEHSYIRGKIFHQDFYQGISYRKYIFGRNQIEYMIDGDIKGHRTIKDSQQISQAMSEQQQAILDYLETHYLPTTNSSFKKKELNNIK